MITFKMMETADDTSETQSQTQNDLLWDHAGDVESDPLLGREANGNRHTLQLSYEQAEDLLRILNHTRSVLENFVSSQAQTGESSSGSNSSSYGGRWRRGERSWWAYHCFPDRRRSVAKYIFFITAILQAANLLVVTLIDHFPKQDDTAVYGTGITMILLQLLNLSFIIMVSLRLVRQLSKHKVSLLLLAQSYVATLLLFAGIYTLTYRLDEKSWQFIEEKGENDPVLVIELYSKFLFFSVSTATLCGSDNVLPKNWYNCVFASLQMLLSFIYFASILGQTLSQDTRYWLGVGGPKPPHHPPTLSVNGDASTTGTIQAQDCSHSVESTAALRVPGSGVLRHAVQQNYGSAAQQSYGSAGHTVVTLEGRSLDREVERSSQPSVTVDVAADRRRSGHPSPFPS